MNMFLPGMESEIKITALIKLTKITSQPIISAVYDHLCRGRTESGAAAKNFIEQPNLNRAVVRLNKAVEIVEEIKNDDWAKFVEKIKLEAVEEYKKSVK